MINNNNNGDINSEGILIKNGPLQQRVCKLFKKTWQLKCCSLHTFNNPHVKLLRIYHSEKDFISGEKLCSGEVLQLQSRSLMIAERVYAKNQEYAFMVIGKNKRAVFAAGSNAEMISWINCLNAVIHISSGDHEENIEALRTLQHVEPETLSSDRPRLESSLSDGDICTSSDLVRCFHVDLCCTWSSIKCNLPSGSYVLLVNNTQLSLAHDHSHRVDDKLIYVWPYKYIRRYGRNKPTDNIFSFEAGRKCESGEGLFSFISPQASEIFNFVMKQTVKLKREELKQFGSWESFGSLSLSGNIMEDASLPSADSLAAAAVVDGDDITENGEAQRTSEADAAAVAMVADSDRVEDCNSSSSPSLHYGSVNIVDTIVSPAAAVTVSANVRLSAITEEVDGNSSESKPRYELACPVDESKLVEEQDDSAYGSKAKPWHYNRTKEDGQWQQAVRGAGISGGYPEQQERTENSVIPHSTSQQTAPVSVSALKSMFEKQIQIGPENFLQKYHTQSYFHSGSSVNEDSRRGRDFTPTEYDQLYFGVNKSLQYGNETLTITNSCAGSPG